MAKHDRPLRVESTPSPARLGCSKAVVAGPRPSKLSRPTELSPLACVALGRSRELQPFWHVMARPVATAWTHPSQNCGASRGKSVALRRSPGTRGDQRCFVARGPRSLSPGRGGGVGQGLAREARRRSFAGEGLWRVFACQALIGATASAWSPRRSHAMGHDLPTRSPVGGTGSPTAIPHRGKLGSLLISGPALARLRPTSLGCRPSQASRDNRRLREPACSASAPAA